MCWFFAHNFLISGPFFYQIKYFRFFKKTSKIIAEIDSNKIKQIVMVNSKEAKTNGDNITEVLRVNREVTAVSSMPIF